MRQIGVHASSVFTPSQLVLLLIAQTNIDRDDRCATVSVTDDY